MAKLKPNQKLIYDAETGKAKIVPRENPKLNASAKIQQRTSKRSRAVSPAKAALR